MRQARSRIDEKPFEPLNVVPFIDVLLTMVLTTASFIATGRIQVSLPQASRAEVDKHKDRAIEIAPDDAVYFNGAHVSPGELRERLAPLPADTAFLIRADRAIAFQSFLDVVDLLKEMRFAKVAVQTRGQEK